MRVLVDPATQRLHELSDSLDAKKLAARTLIDLASSVRTKLPPPSELIEGADAADYLRELIALTEKEIVVEHGAYGAIRWLWYLRRTPNRLFEGSVSTTMLYDRTLSEVLMLRCHADDQSILEDRVAFKVDDAVLRHLARLIGRVKFLSQLHVLYRLIGKGATLDAKRTIPSATLSAASRNAVQIYDERHEKGSALL